MITFCWSDHQLLHIPDTIPMDLVMVVPPVSKDLGMFPLFQVSCTAWWPSVNSIVIIVEYNEFYLCSYITSSVFPCLFVEVNLSAYHYVALSNVVFSEVFLCVLDILNSLGPIVLYKDESISGGTHKIFKLLVLWSFSLLSVFRSSVFICHIVSFHSLWCPLKFD